MRYARTRYARGRYAAPETAEVPVTPAACGTSLLRTGMAWLTDQLQAHASEPVVYRRGGNAVALCATPGSTRLLLSDELGGTRVEYTDRDWLIPTASLILAGSAALPKRGDTIEHTDGGLVHTYEVYPFNNEPPWQWSDPFRKMLRIRTKRLTSEPA